jgi:hypothetical protein
LRRGVVVRDLGVEEGAIVDGELVEASVEARRPDPGVTAEACVRRGWLRPKY